MEDIIGCMAATLTTFCFIPQALLVMRTKQTQGISLPMYCIFCAGITLWLVYGLMIGSLPVILSNSITLPLVIFIIAMKIRLG